MYTATEVHLLSALKIEKNYNQVLSLKNFDCSKMLACDVTKIHQNSCLVLRMHFLNDYEGGETMTGSFC